MMKWERGIDDDGGVERAYGRGVQVGRAGAFKVKISRTEALMSLVQRRNFGIWPVS